MSAIFGAAILAAGASSRMGRPKMLLPWGTATVLAHLLAQWQRASAAQIAVVCAAGDSAVASELDRLGVPNERRIINPEPARGMFSSIQCAAAWRGWLPTVQHIALTLGDQPHLEVETLRAVAQFAAKTPGSICQPGRNGRPRHPVFVPRNIFGAIAASRHNTLKEFLAEHEGKRRVIEINDAGLDFDIDTPVDYEAAKQRFLHRA